MTRPRYTSYLSLLYIVGLLALLAILAALQYRWTGEASLAEQERMRQGLNESLGYFERSFDREISLVILSYWGFPVATIAQTSDWQPAVSQLLVDAAERWRASATDPRLINRVLVAESRVADPPCLYSFRAGASRLEETEWPADLARLKNLLQPPTDQPLPREEGVPTDRHERRRLPGYFIIDELPALVTLLAPERDEPRRERPQSGAQPSDRARLFLIVCLDHDYLFRERIPALAKRYLSRDADSGYDYAITSRQNPQLILCSSPGADPAGVVALPDARINLMRLQEEEFGDQQRSEGVRGPAPSLPDAGTRRRSPSRLGGGGVPGGGGAPGGEMVEIDRRAQELVIERRRHLQTAAEMLASRGWELSAKHRSGSLNAAVASARLRNLGVSLGILLLLAVSLVVLTISVRRAQRLSRQQMEFVAGVSHELRTPIAVICSTAENLADGVITANDQVRRYAHYILREAWRLDTLVEQTLEFAGIGSGIRRFHMQLLDLGGCINDAVDGFRAQIAEKKLNIEVCAAPGAVVNGDAAALSCAIGNLLSNAVKYNRPGGQIRVTLERRPQAETVVLSVADEGMGIEAAEVRHLFEPFFRGSNALRAQIRGAGIGLSLVKKIVEAHHGTITVKSTIEQGSVFTLVLPAAQVAAPEEKHEVT